MRLSAVGHGRNQRPHPHKPRVGHPQNILHREVGVMVSCAPVRDNESPFEYRMGHPPREEETPKRRGLGESCLVTSEERKQKASRLKT